MASYKKKYSKYKMHKIKPKKFILKRLWFWVVILLLLIILSLLYFVIFYPGLQVKNITIMGNDRVKTHELYEIADKYSTNELINFWGTKVISKSIFLFNKNKTNEDILEKFPEVDSLTIEKFLPETITINITERKPLGAFCSNEECFLIDQRGVIFKSLTTLPVDLTIVRQNSKTTDLIIGQEVVEQNMINTIYKIKKNIKDNFKIDINEVSIINSTRLNVETSENWKIYFDLDQDNDIDSQIAKLNLLLNGEISSEGRKNLKYIDLRPKDRAIVCDNSTCGG